MNLRQRVLALLEGRPVDRLPLMPITMMFAADRIGRPYRDYATDYRVLVEGQLRVAAEFGFDYVSCISDPAREAADCGATVQFFPNQPPAIVEEQALLTDKGRLDTLKAPDPRGGGRMTDRVRAAGLFRERVGGELLIEGWIEGPCAQAADLRGINNLMLDFYDDPEFVRRLFAFVVDLELQFAKAQIEAGVELMGKRPHLSPLDWTDDRLKQLRALCKQHALEVACVAAYTNFTGGAESAEYSTSHADHLLGSSAMSWSSSGAERSSRPSFL